MCRDKGADPYNSFQIFNYLPYRTGYGLYFSSWWKRPHTYSYGDATPMTAPQVRKVATQTDSCPPGRCTITNHVSPTMRHHNASTTTNHVSPTGGDATPMTAPQIRKVATQTDSCPPGRCASYPPQTCQPQPQPCHPLPHPRQTFL